MIKALELLCANPYRCHYCEDSAAEEIEHYYPQARYPEYVFVWENYFYICGKCNSIKGSKFKLRLKDGTTWDKAHTQPPPGQPLFINLRNESGLDYLELNLSTFLYRTRKNCTDTEKANYILEVLQLNDRDALVNARSCAYDDYKARLISYTNAKLNNTPIVKLEKLKSSITKSPHPAVWFEMKRYCLEKPQKLQKVDTELYNLFQQTPEVLSF